MSYKYYRLTGHVRLAEQDELYVRYCESSVAVELYYNLRLGWVKTTTLSIEELTRDFTNILEEITEDECNAYLSMLELVS